MEDPISQRGQTCGEGYGSKGTAELEGVVSQAGDPVWKGDAGEVITVSER